MLRHPPLHMWEQEHPTIYLPESDDVYPKPREF